jgi:hypothetical protein
MTAANTPNPPVAAPVPEKPVSAWIWAFRCLRWSTYLAALITLILLLHKTPPPAVQSSPQAAASAEEKLAQAEQTISQGQKATLRLDESEVNSFLASRLEAAKDAPSPATSSVAPAVAPDAAQQATAGNDTPTAADIEQVRNSVKDVKVQMEGDQVRAYVVFDVHGKDMTLNLVGKLGSQDGYLKFEPVSGQLGSLPLPQSTLEAAVRRIMESPENREKLKLPDDVSDMHIENGQLVATYK